MQKPITLQKDYTQNSGGYQLKLPLNIETIIPEDDSVRLLSQFVEAMDLTDLYSTYERINSVSPKNTSEDCALLIHEWGLFLQSHGVKLQKRYQFYVSVRRRTGT